VAEKIVMVGVTPDVVAIDSGDQVVWYSNAGNLKIEFDPKRSPFAADVFQAPPGVRLSSGPARPGINPGSYRYRLLLNDVVVAHCEVLIRVK
jgi:DNA-binding beta-propeller fold protein YncE